MPRTMSACCILTRPWNPGPGLLMYRIKRFVRGETAMTMLRLIVGALALLFAGTAVNAADPVVIGLEIPLSPPGDPTAGQLIRRGAELAVEYINGTMGGVLDGRKAELAVQDSQGRTESGVAAYRRLVTEDKAIAVTGFFHSSANLAANEVAKELGVPTIA